MISNNNETILSWLRSKHTCDFKSKFSDFLDRKVLEAIKDSSDGISLFIKGLNAEFYKQNYTLALSYYEDGANQLDCFCLYRLFDIYLGSADFKTEYNEEKCLTYLAYGAALESFDYKLGLWTLFQTFKNMKDPELKKINKILDNPIPTFSHFPHCPSLISVFIKLQLMTIDIEFATSLVKKLTVEERRVVSFPVVSHLMDLMTTKLQTVSNNESVKEFVDVLISLHTDCTSFDPLYKHYYTMLNLAGISKNLGAFFSHRLENMFWVWVFSFLNIAKNIYLSELTPLIDNFLTGNIVFKWSNTMSWIRSYRAFHLEKGLGCKMDLEQALEQLNQEIEVNPTALYARIRRIIILRKQGKTDEEEYYKQEFKKVFDERLGQPGRIDCYLFYVMGKYQEKVLDSVDSAIKWYQKGVDAENICHKVQWFGNESWRLYCEKKRTKLMRKIGEGSATSPKWIED